MTLEAIHRTLTPRTLGAVLELLCVAALAIACAAQVERLEEVVDLALWDEADYLRIGLNLPQRGLPTPEWGPLYVLWYHLGSKLVADPTALFYASYRALVVLPALALYFTARRLGAAQAVALALSVLFLLSGAPHVVPRPTLLALLVVLSGAGAATYLRSSEARLAIVGTSLLLASFARPELFVSFAIFSGALVLALARRLPRGGARRSSAVLGVHVVTAAALIALLGNPFGNASNRRLYAFCQHFAIGYVERADLAVEPWGQCSEAMKAAFGPRVDGVAEAAMSNPSEFWAHVRANLVKYPRASLHLAVRAIKPSLHLDLSGGAAALVPFLCAPLLLAAAALALGWNRARLGRARRDARVRLALLLAIAVLVPSILSAVLIHPRDHYLVFQAVFVPLAIAALVGAARGGPNPATRAGVTGAAAVEAGPGAIARRRWLGAAATALALVLGSGSLVRASPPGPLVHREVVETLKAHRARLSPGAPFNILEESGGYDVYVGRGSRRIAPTERRPGEAFGEFLARTRVGAVVIDPKLRAHRAFAGDREFAAFVADPEELGFVALNAGGAVTVLVRALPATGEDQAATTAPPSRPARARCPAAGCRDLDA